MKRIFFRSYRTVKRIIYFDENLRSNVKQNLHHNNFYTINAAEFRGIWDEIRIFLNKKKLQQSSRMQTSWPFFIATPNAIKFLQTSQKTLWTHTEFDFILEAFLRLILEMTDGCFSILQLFWGNLRFSPRLWTNTLHFNHVVLESELWICISLIRFLRSILQSCIYHHGKPKNVMDSTEKFAEDLSINGNDSTRLHFFYIRLHNKVSYLYMMTYFMLHRDYFEVIIAVGLSPSYFDSFTAMNGLLRIRKNYWEPVELNSLFQR